jgi:hypothetical protein
LINVGTKEPGKLIDPSAIAFATGYISPYRGCLNLKIHIKIAEAERLKTK